MRRRDIVALGLAAAAAPRTAWAQPRRVSALDFGVRQRLRSPADIPRRRGRTRFQTFTLFLSTKLGPADPVEGLLSQEFDNFGVAIGDRNLAIFVVNSAGHLDSSMGRTLIDHVNAKYGAPRVSYDNGPYAIVLPRHLQDAKAPGERATVISFNNQSQADVAASLAELRELVSAPSRQGERESFNNFWTSVIAGFNAGTGGAAGRLTGIFFSA